MDRPPFENDSLLFLNEDALRKQIKDELRKEFIDVYNRNELFYQDYVKNLTQTIVEKDRIIKKLVDLLHSKESDLKSKQ